MIHKTTALDIAWVVACVAISSTLVLSLLASVVGVVAIKKGWLK